MLRKGGGWLGAARSWIQWTFLNGSDVTWGSDDHLRGRELTVQDVESLASQVAAAVVDELKSNPSAYDAGSIPTQNALGVSALIALLQGAEDWEILDHNGNRMAIHYHYDADKGGVLICRPKSDFSFPQLWAAEKPNIETQR